MLPCHISTNLAVKFAISTVGDFLDTHGVPEELHDDVASALRCRAYGRDDFTTCDEIGLAKNPHDAVSYWVS